MNFVSPQKPASDDLRVSAPEQIDTDILVIGSGAGGSVVAATAAELGHSVVMLEEGPYVPFNQAPTHLMQAQAILYRQGGLTTAYGTPSIAYTEARCVGGSTEINNAVFERIPSILLADWQRRYSIKDFGTLALAPHYEWAANIIKAQPPAKSSEESDDILERAAKTKGWETKRAEQGHHHCVGTNMCLQSCPTGAKQSMSATIIPQLRHKGHRIIAEAEATRIAMRGPWVRYVEAQARDAEGRKHKLKIKAHKIFLCAGAIQTPALLQKTGFRGVVGRRLRMQPILSCVALFDRIIDRQAYRKPLTTVTEFMPDFQISDALFTPSLYGQTIGQDWRHRFPYINHMRQAASYQIMLRSEGYGQIHAMPYGSPFVTYKLDKQDWPKLSEGLKKLSQSLLEAGAGMVLPSFTGHGGWRTPDEVLEDAPKALHHKRAYITNTYASGSCPMGENPDLCGVDSFGRVHGASNLYVADASIIPEAPSVSTQATVMTLARRNALHILESKHLN